MDIKILDSHLRDHLKTNAKHEAIAKALSLSSASVERVESFGNDWIYSVEVTTNRPDMLSVRGLAREASAVLPEFGFSAELIPLKLKLVKSEISETNPIKIENDATLVRRICAVVMDVEIGQSPKYIRERLEAAGIRSLNNLIDITNYVMLEIGHPTHVFDYDRLKDKTLIIRPSKRGERIVTLDKKEHILQGGDIVADNGKGEIIDLLGVMGTDNSVVTDGTKRILFFLDNNDPWKIRKTSMGLGIRTEAAVLNEKGVDPQLAMDALLRGISLYKEIAKAKITSDIVDIYPKKSKPISISVDSNQISKTIGVEIPLNKSISILKSLGFDVIGTSTLKVTVPSWREEDVTSPEDIIEEVARVYGYFKLPSLLPSFEKAEFYHQDKNKFYWEEKAKNIFKYFGFSESYTYSMVSETMLEGPIEEAITLSNPLDIDHVHMRTSLTPSLLETLKENIKRQNVQVFEIANTYHKEKKGDLPKEIKKLGFVIKGNHGTFYHAKGFIEGLIKEFGIEEIDYKEPLKGGLGTSLYIGRNYLGDIEVISQDTVSAELNFDLLVENASSKKVFKALAKYPSITEDLSFLLPENVKTGIVIREIKKQSDLIKDVLLIDMFNDSRAFHIVYQSRERNLTTEEIAEIRKRIVGMVEKKFEGKAK